MKPVLHLFRTETLAEKEEDTDLTKGIKSNALDYLEEKYSDPATQVGMGIDRF